MGKSNTSVKIRGSGIAALCCAFLLRKAGFHVELEETCRPKVPAILLSHSSLSLMRDIFDDPDLCRDSPAIYKRIVAWNPSSAPLSLDHAAIVVSEEWVLQSIRATASLDNRQEKVQPDWTIFASQPLPEGCKENRFGARTGSVVSVELTDRSAAAACWIESVAEGWLFLIETTPSTGWLLAIGDTLAPLLDQSSIIQRRIARCGPCSSGIPVYPRISTPLFGQQWLACGSAAMAFDPICGDGTAHAIREAILAAAVIRAAVAGREDIESVTAHYQKRLLAGFRKHLAMCLEFYSRGHQTRWWEEESAALKRGLQWCDARVEHNPVFRYRLEGFDLYPIR